MDFCYCTAVAEFRVPAPATAPDWPHSVAPYTLSAQVNTWFRVKKTAKTTDCAAIQSGPDRPCVARQHPPIDRPMLFRHALRTRTFRLTAAAHRVALAAGPATTAWTRSSWPPVCAQHRGQTFLLGPGGGGGAGRECDRVSSAVQPERPGAKRVAEQHGSIYRRMPGPRNGKARSRP